MEKPDILKAIDEALETTLPEGILAGAEGRIMHDAAMFLEVQPSPQLTYEGVSIRSSLAQLGQKGWAVKVRPGFEKP